jgi:small GTP-binding protein
LNCSRIHLVWDTAGQEKYQSLAPLYYRGAIAAILVYDICNSPSYDALPKWLKRLQEVGPKGLIKIIVGNKCDLQEERQVMKETAELFSIKENCLYLEASARDNVNVEQIFHEIGNLLPQLSISEKAALSNGQSLRLDEAAPSIRQRCGC